MKKRLLTLALLGWGISAFAQDAAKPTLLSNPVLKEITVLKSLADQIAEAETVFATSSRSGAAEAKENLDALLLSYAKELENQEKIFAKDAKKLKVIEDELKLVASKK
jgi:hypothetical protein